MSSFQFSKSFHDHKAFKVAKEVPKLDFIDMSVVDQRAAEAEAALPTVDDLLHVYF